MYIFINLGIILVGVGLTFLAIKLSKIKDTQSRLIFILYMIFWIPTLICRDYTGSMQEHIQSTVYSGAILIVPLMAYGLIGLLFRPLVDLLSIKMKSRKNVIFLALGIQLATLIPFIFVPNTATSIIQSIGCGIAASCIGLFNLIFDDNQRNQTVFASISILAIPPILAQIFASSIESLVATAIPAIYTHNDYINTMLSLWAISCVLIVAAFVMAIFVKPRKRLLYSPVKQKTQIKSKSSWFSFIMLCLGGMFVLIIRWITAGPTAGIQLTYISAHYGTQSKYYEGFTGFIYTLGQLVGTIITTYSLSKWHHKEKEIRSYLTLASVGVGIAYCILSGFLLNVPAFIGLLTLSGFSYGLIYPVIIAVAVKKIFPNTKYQTPMGLLNTFLALGICIGTFVVTWWKAPVFDQIHGFSTYSFDDFITQNWNMMFLCIACELTIVVCYLVSRTIDNKYPEKLVTKKNVANLMGDTEL